MGWEKRLWRYMGWGTWRGWEGDGFGNENGLVKGERLGTKTGWEGRRVCGEMGWEGHASEGDVFGDGDGLGEGTGWMPFSESAQTETQTDKSPQDTQKRKQYIRHVSLHSLGTPVRRLGYALME